MSTITALSVNQAHVAAAILSAVDGDEVVIPAGTAHWMSVLAYTKNIWLHGQTLVTGDHTTGLTVDDQTIIIDDVPNVDGGAVLIQAQFTAGDPGVVSGRISGISIHQGSRTSTPDFGGIVIKGTSRTVRIDHCYFLNVAAQNINVYDATRGVIDHCKFTSNHFNAAVFFLNGSDQYGDITWNQAAGFGTDDFMFFEDNHTTWTGDPGTPNAMGLDAYAGAKYVCRKNIFENGKPNTHGTETSGRMRSVRAIEVYDNDLRWTMGYSPNAGQIRGGTARIWGNAYTNYGDGYVLRIYRMFFSYIFHGSDGTVAWDQNADSDGTTPVAAGASGHLFYSGTHTGSNGAAVLTDSGASFPGSNGLRPYVIRNMGADGNTFRWNSYFGALGSNTSTTATLGQTVDDNGSSFLWNNGDHYEIRKVLIALDQPGRGQGDLIVGANDSGSAPYWNMHISGGPNNGIPAWPRQALEPIHSWGNLNNGSPLNISAAGEPTLVENRDYYNVIDPDYTPYTYPHPLITDSEGGGSGGEDTTNPIATLSAPANLATVSNTISLAATATDDTAVVAGQFKVDGVNHGAEISGAGPFSGSLDTTALTNGSHTVSFTARDGAGNTGSSTHTITVNNVTPSGGGGGGGKHKKKRGAIERRR